MKEFRAQGLSEESEAFDILRLVKKNPHPNVVEHIDFWPGENQGYIVMELCKGSLADLQQKCHGPMPQRLCYEILIQVASGIEHLHSSDLGICHRDLKPENGSSPRMVGTDLRSLISGRVERQALLQNRRLRHISHRNTWHEDFHEETLGNRGIPGTGNTIYRRYIRLKV